MSITTLKCRLLHFVFRLHSFMVVYILKKNEVLEEDLFWKQRISHGRACSVVSAGGLCYVVIGNLDDVGVSGAGASESARYQYSMRRLYSYGLFQV